MQLKNIIEIAASIIIAFGGSSVIILGLSRWLGEIISNRILERYKFRHEKELEALKTKYSTELEITKSELDKSKHLFYKYSDKQFELYNNLWKVIWDIKKQADSLWQKAEAEKLPKFSKTLRNVKEALY